MTTESKEVSEKDGVRIAEDARRKPRLIAKETKFGDMKIRMDKRDKRYLKRLYDDLGDMDIDVVGKNREFGVQDWITVQRHIFEALKPFYDVTFEKSRVLERLKKR